MTEDRELLEMAAKAVGYERNSAGPVGPCEWNPLTDDGDALRLAAQLKIDIEWQSTNPFPEDTVEAYRRNPEGEFFCAMYPEDDYRRAITRAAAEIGKKK